MDSRTELLKIAASTFPTSQLVNVTWEVVPSVGFTAPTTQTVTLLKRDGGTYANYSDNDGGNSFIYTTKTFSNGVPLKFLLDRTDTNFRMRIAGGVVSYVGTIRTEGSTSYNRYADNIAFRPAIITSTKNGQTSTYSAIDHMNASSLGWYYHGSSGDVTTFIEIPLDNCDDGITEITIKSVLCRESGWVTTYIDGVPDHAVYHCYLQERVWDSSQGKVVDGDELYECYNTMLVGAHYYESLIPTLRYPKYVYFNDGSSNPPVMETNDVTDEGGSGMGPYGPGSFWFYKSTETGSVWRKRIRDTSYDGTDSAGSTKVITKDPELTFSHNYYWSVIDDYTETHACVNITISGLSSYMETGYPVVVKIAGLENESNV